LDLTLDIIPATIGDKSVLRQLIELYQYDWSGISPDLDVDAHGLYGYDYLDHYWTEKERYPFLVRVNGRYAGFVLVNDYVLVPGNQRSMAEFFVMRKYRRQGVGKRVAFEIFDRLPAKWEVRQVNENTVGVQFWRKVIGEYTGGKYQETLLEGESWSGPAQSFDNREGRFARSERGS
jgi:predicted acetyltransferase